MQTHDFPGTNVKALPPPGFEEMIGNLHVFHNGASCVSAWSPDDREAFAKYILDEGSIFVSVMSGSKHDIRGELVPTIIPMFVGTEDDCERVVSDTGRTWK